MANPRSSIFNQAAQDRLRSPDDLDKYVRVTTPRVWVMLAAVVVLMLGLLSWGIFGTVSSSVEVTGTCVEGTTLCMVDAEQVSSINAGDLAYIEGQRTVVADVSTVPISRDEASALLQSDYLVDALMPKNWAYVVTFEDVDVALENVPIAVSITTERVAPISLVLG